MVKYGKLKFEIKINDDDAYAETVKRIDKYLTDMMLDFPYSKVSWEVDDKLYLKHKTTEQRNTEINIDKIKNLAIDGLLTQEGHHKQWYLEKIIEEIGVDTKEIKEKLEEEGYDFEEGIPP